MNKDDKLYIGKVLFISKLALVLVLSFVVVKTVLLPAYVEKNLSSASTLGGDGVPLNEMTKPSDLSIADYAEIIERNPFGTSGQRTGTGKGTSMANLTGFEQSVSEELGLALFGAVSGNPTVARAIIKDLKTGALGLYKMGQTIADARVQNIGKDLVILVHNGQEKVLRLSTARSGSYNYKSTQGPSGQTIDEKSYAIGTDLSTRKTDTGVRVKTGYMEKILKKAVIEPYVVDGHVEGLRITDLEDIEGSKDFGLKNGDVIRVVNGHTLTSKQKAYQIFKKARSQTSISLELLRDGKAEKLSFARK